MSDHFSNHTSHKKISEQKTIGLIPAAGKAARLAPLPFSKELYTIGFQTFENDNRLHPKHACVYLLEKMRLANTSEAFIVLRNGKWDIPAYLRDGKMLNMHLAYLMMDLPFGVPYTLDQAYPFVRDSIVVFGFPDIIFQPDNVYKELLAKQEKSNAAVVLGLFPANKPLNKDMVDLHADGRVRGILKQPDQTSSPYTWITAVWNPLFTAFMHDSISARQKEREKTQGKNQTDNHHEFFLSDVIHDAANNGLQVESVIFSEGTYLDIGTPENLVKATKKAV
jgi:glucose-1-phosphate thymidylyltransferase